MGRSRCLACFGSCVWFTLRIIVFVYFSWIVKVCDVWQFLIEQPPGCAHDELPGNRSGIKVLVVGFAKSGTRTICHALNEIGVRSYHSEDFHFLPWWDFVHDIRWGDSPYAGQQAPALIRSMRDDKDLANQLTRKVSKCRMEAVALDGLELLTEPLLEGSGPDVKVIALTWRTYDQWRKSFDTFNPKLMVMIWFQMYTGASFNVLPWLALLRPLDQLAGRPIEKVIRDGGPPITELSGPLIFTYHQSVNHRRQYECWVPPGSTIIPESKEEYEKHLNDWRNMVPKERIFDFDPRKNTKEELCAFLGIDPCPSQGKTGRAINTWIFERDFPIASNVCLFARLFMHWVNWKLFGSFLSFAGRQFRCCRDKATKAD